MTKPISIVIADDHAIVREGLRTLIGVKPGLEVIGEAANGKEAVSLAKTLQPDVILMDLKMPHKNGIEVINDIKRHKPQARILVLTSFDDDEWVFSAIKAGALGYLLKDSSPQQLIQAIHDIHEGKSSLHPAVALKVIRELNQSPDLTPTEEPLTERELETLQLIAQGLSNQEIAEKLTISERTAGKHVSNILEKLQLANRTQAALYALRRGIAKLESS